MHEQMCTAAANWRMLEQMNTAAGTQRSPQDRAGEVHPGVSIHARDARPETHDRPGGRTPQSAGPSSVGGWAMVSTGAPRPPA